MQDILPYLDKAFLATEDVLHNLVRIETELDAEERQLSHPLKLFHPEWISVNVQLMTVRRAVDNLVKSRASITELRHMIQKQPS